MRHRVMICTFLCGYLAVHARGEEKPIEKPIDQPFEYAAAMKKVAAKFTGRPGVVIHVGDSITYANPAGAWPRYGEGRTEADKAVLQWMHAGKDDDRDGWWLARTDLPGGHSYTACGGIRINEMLAGSKGDMPSLAKLLEKYKPQIVVLMLGTNDATAGRSAADYRRDMASALDLILREGVIPIVSTIPPHVNKPELAKAYNEAIRELAKERHIPLSDFEKEILLRRPNDWDGTLMNKGDVHPTANFEKITAASAPTAENLRNSGYLLRGWLTVKKIGEVKRTVLDDARPPAPKPDDKK